MRSMTLRCEINIHIYVRFAWTVSNCGRNHQQRIRPHGAVGYNTDLILHAPYSQGTGSESDIRGGKETQTGVLLTHTTHTHTHTHTHTRTARTQRYRLLHVACSW